MEGNKKSIGAYNEHVSSIHKLIQDTYGVEYHAMAYAITTNLISPRLLMSHLMTGDPIPDPEYIMFSLAKDLSECKVAKHSFTKYLKGFENPTKLDKLLEEAMELTENAGFGDIEH